MVEKIVNNFIKEEEEKDTKNQKVLLLNHCCELYLHFVKGCYGKNDERDASHWKNTFLTSVRNIYSIISLKKKPDFSLVKTCLVAKPLSKNKLLEVHKDFEDHKNETYVWNKISKTSIDQEYIKFIEKLEEAYLDRISSNDFVNFYISSFQVPEVD